MILVKESIETITEEKNGKAGIGSGQYATYEFETKDGAKKFVYGKLRQLMQAPAGFKANVRITEQGIAAMKQLGTSYHWEYIEPAEAPAAEAEDETNEESA